MDIGISTSSLRCPTLERLVDSLSDRLVRLPPISSLTSLPSSYGSGGTCGPTSLPTLRRIPRWCCGSKSLPRFRRGCLLRSTSMRPANCSFGTQYFATSQDSRLHFAFACSYRSFSRISLQGYSLVRPFGTCSIQSLHLDDPNFKFLLYFPRWLCHFVKCSTLRSGSCI